jgi:DNA-binding Lrp family transcriptional regulator
LAIAFILINVDSGKEREITQELRAIGNVSSVYFVYGVYDIVVKVEAQSQEQLKETITWKIRQLEGIRSTQTLMAMD